MTNKGKVTEDQIKQLKLAYPDVALFKWTSPNGKDEIVFRPITQKLFKVISEMIHQAERANLEIPTHELNEKVFDSCVVWPPLSVEEKLKAPVGLVPSVVKSIQEKSGYVDIDITNRVIAPDFSTKVINDFQYWEAPTEEEIQKLKDHLPILLVQTRIDRWIFILRALTRIDIQVIQNTPDDEQLATAKAVTVWPAVIDWGNIPAGVVDMIARKAFEISGAPSNVEVEEL